jgi:hypothetical protein
MIDLSFLAHLRKPRRRSGLRNRIIVNSVVILLVLVIATSYTAFASFDLARSVELLFRNSISMEELRSTLRDTQENLTAISARRIRNRSKSSSALQPSVGHDIQAEQREQSR